MFLTGSLPASSKLKTTSPLVVPPHLPSFDFVGYCPAQCTRQMLPANGSYILYERLHMHMLSTGGEAQVREGDKGKLGPG